ncbi:MAG: 50S ribosomal protein L25 [Finegoldia sp.]|nr:50S ribosomal protein L25 [Finegoldia sp.]
MANYKLDADKREVTGSNAVKKLRTEGVIPGVIYGEDQAINVQVSEKELDKIYLMAGTSSLIDLKVDGEEKTVIIQEVQMHPYKNHYLHVDFKTINMNVTSVFTIPVVLLNRDNINVEPAVLMQQIEEIDIECLPKDLPSEATVDVESMQIGDSFTVKDLDVSKDDKIKVLVEEDEVVCSLQEPKMEEVSDEEETDAADVPTVGETEEAESGEGNE